MVARLVRDQKVVGSSPVTSTKIPHTVDAVWGIFSWLGNTGLEGRQEKRSFSQVGGFYRRLDSN